MRRTLFSDLPGSSDGPSEPAPASGVEPGSHDLGRWLIRDLRAKGSHVPLVDRSSQPPSVSIPILEQAELADWLLRDLRPRSGAPHDQRLPRESLLPLSSPTELASVAVGEPPDSLVPHALSEAPLALSGALEPALEEDDLAVLPSRRGKSRERSRRRALVLLAALLGVAGLSLWLRSGGHAEATGDATPAANAPVAAAPLPPPPPDFSEGTDQELAVPTAAAPARRSGAPVDPGAGRAEEEEPGLRGRRAGDAVARFADLPLSTQSKLAREERQKTRARDASARAHKSASSARP
jgi:hypothetical protein